MASSAHVCLHDDGCLRIGLGNLLRCDLVGVVAAQPLLWLVLVMVQALHLPLC
jgi:hypothetical protein